MDLFERKRGSLIEFLCLKYKFDEIGYDDRRALQMIMLSRILKKKLKRLPFMKSSDFMSTFKNYEKYVSQLVIKYSYINDCSGEDQR